MRKTRDTVLADYYKASNGRSLRGRVLELRANKAGWRRIADTLAEDTSGEVQVSHESLRGWFGEAADRQHRLAIEGLYHAAVGRSLRDQVIVDRAERLPWHVLHAWVVADLHLVGERDPDVTERDLQRWYGPLTDEHLAQERYAHQVAEVTA